MIKWRIGRFDSFRGQADGPVVEVEAGEGMYCRVLNAYEMIEDACEEFASTFDHGDDDGAVTCVGRLYSEDGEVQESVRFVFTPTTPAEFDHVRSWG